MQMANYIKKGILLSLIFPILFVSVRGQSDLFVFAVTSTTKSGTDWISLRRLNTQTGEFSTIIPNGADKGIPVYDAVSQQKVDHFTTDTLANSNPQSAFGSGVSAIAYDKETNRLYYTPVLIDQIRYIDLNTMKIFCVIGQSYSRAGNLEFTPGTITRMVITPDGYGYSITNDGSHLFQFNIKGEMVLKDLGELEDVATNTETIHNVCGNAGGDMIADDSGNLYLITSSNRIFKLEISTRKTQFLGIISGLPPNYTTSGAAIDNEGHLLLSSSTYTEGYFSVNTLTWSASPYKRIDGMHATADLANSNVLNSSGSFFLKKLSVNSNKIRIYPNPVFQDAFSIQFNNLKVSNYTMQLIDITGRPVFQQKIKVNQPLQTEEIHIPGSILQGTYFVRIFNENNISVSTQLVLIER